MHGICTTKAIQRRIKYLKQKEIVVPLVVDEAVECCNSFVLLPKPNWNVRLCQDPVGLNLELFHLVHRGSATSL